MRKLFKRWVVVGLMCCLVPALYAQDDTPKNEDAETGTDVSTPESSLSRDVAIQWMELEGQLVNNPAWPTYYYNEFDPALVATGGNYAAQDHNELQTYYDLGLGYRYIEEKYLRRQLALPVGQGIIIESANESGMGFESGFRSGDIVLQVGDEPVDTQYKFVIALAKERGTSQVARIRRDGKGLDLRVSLPLTNIDTPTRLIIGVYVDEITEVTKTQLGIEGGAAVTQVTEDGPSEKMGVKVHDIITHIDGTLINNLDDLKQVVENSGGKDLTLDLIRSARKISLVVTPDEVEHSTADFWRTELVLEMANDSLYRQLSRRAVPRPQWSLLLNGGEAIGQTEDKQETKASPEQALLEQYESLTRKVEQLTEQVNEITEKVEK